MKKKNLLKDCFNMNREKKRRPEIPILKTNDDLITLSHNGNEQMLVKFVFVGIYTLVYNSVCNAYFQC
jgi:hypothetical protein